jgi:hypothetical protein
MNKFRLFLVVLGFLTAEPALAACPSVQPKPVGSVCCGIPNVPVDRRDHPKPPGQYFETGPAVWAVSDSTHNPYVETNSVEECMRWAEPMVNANANAYGCIVPPHSPGGQSGQQHHRQFGWYVRL